MNCKNLISQASMMNTEGVHALSMGNAPAAHHCFRQALETLAHATDLSSQEPVSMDGEAAMDSCDWRRSILSHCPVPGLDNDGFYLCNNALLYSLQDFQGRDISSTAIAVCCNCTMFNMALTLHQRGIAMGSRSNLLSAGRLYEQCLKLSDDLPGPANDANVMNMAILNNIAQVHLSLEDFDSALDTLQSVQTLLPETNIEDCVSPALPTILQMDEVILNILVTSAPTMAACA